MSFIDAHFILQLGDFHLNAEIRLEQTKVCVLYGPSGSGKTTLLKCLAGLHQPSGHCQVQGVIWQDDDSKRFLAAHQRNIGYVFQDGNLFSHLNVRDNILFPLRFRQRKNPMEQLRAISERLKINTLLQRRVQNLSGGERQRVAIARAIIGSPSILLLDEPLASLDTEARKEILSCLEDLKNTFNIPMIYVTHAREEFLRLGDDIIMLDKGRVQYSGPIRDLGKQIMDEQRVHGAIIQGIVGEIDSHYCLTRIQVGESTLTIPGLYKIGRQVLLQILAKDVSLIKNYPQDTSILNILSGTIISLEEGPEAAVLVKLQCGENVLLSMITKKSRDNLGLVPGMAVFAQIKSLSLDYSANF